MSKRLPTPEPGDFAYWEVRAEIAEKERDHFKMALRDIAGIAEMDDEDACYQIECIARAALGAKP